MFPQHGTLALHMSTVCDPTAYRNQRRFCFWKQNSRASNGHGTIDAFFDSRYHTYTDIAFQVECMR